MLKTPILGPISHIENTIFSAKQFPPILFFLRKFEQDARDLCQTFDILRLSCKVQSRVFQIFMKFKVFVSAQLEMWKLAIFILEGLLLSINYYQLLF